MIVKCDDLGFKQVYESSNIHDFKHDKIGIVRFYGTDKIDSISFWGVKCMFPDLTNVERLSQRVSEKFEELENEKEV